MTTGASEYLQDPNLRLLVTYFQHKGLKALKHEDRQEEWYPDWIDYQARHGLYASLLSPQKYSSGGHHFDIRKLACFLETFAYFSPAHAYSLHVSLLGLLPILMSDNEPLKKEAIATLEDGGLFAFAVSERAHGSDLFGNEFTVIPTAAGWLADGAKYYIGNVNAARLVSVLAKQDDAASIGSNKRAPFVFFALRPQEAPAFQNVCKIRTLGIRTAFVGSFEVKGHVFPERDVISRGRAAWDAIRGTVNLGKFFLGFGSVGICEHALAEAVAHLRRRVLYGKPVTAMPHIRDALVFAFARLTAMKLYAFRALDYLQIACDADRRHLLWSAVQKARVSTEGVKVAGLLSECIGARGFEAETYFEQALRDVQLVPGLEGSTHINFALTAQFITPYFAEAGCDIPGPSSLMLDQGSPGENSYLLTTHNQTARTVRFPPCLQAYGPLRPVANVRSFLKQVKAFRLFAEHLSSVPAPREGAAATANPDMAGNGQVIAVGKCLAAIAYGQLVAENCLAAGVVHAAVSVMFHALIEDLSAEALKLSAMFPSGSVQRRLLKGVIRVPKTNTVDLQSVSEFVWARYDVSS